MNSTGVVAAAGAVAGVAVALTMMATVAVAQPENGPPRVAESRLSDTTITETADVTLVEVPVHVTTLTGEPVRGLELADFELYDRGQLQSLDGVEIVDLARGTSIPVSGASQERRLETGQPLDTLSVDAVPTTGRRRFLLLFDLVFSRPELIAEARNEARNFVLAGLHPSDLAAVAIFISGGPRFVIGFTSDRAQLARAIDSLGTPALLDGARIEDPLKLLIESPGGRSQLGGPRLGTQPILGDTPHRNDDQAAAVLAHLRALEQGLERDRRIVARGQVSAWTHELRGLANALGNLSGNKTVLFFSEGFDGRLLIGEEGSSEALRERDSLEIERGQRWRQNATQTTGDAGLRKDLQAAVQALRRAGAFVDAIDLTGVETAAASELRGRRNALRSLARGTGGDYYTGSNRLTRSLEKAARSTAVTYVLRFHPRDLVADGSFHPVEIRLTERPRTRLPLQPTRQTRLIHREGYYAPRPFQELHPLEKSLLAADAVVAATPRRDFKVDVLLAPFRAEGDRFHVPVVLEIDGQALLALNASDPSQPTLEIFVYITDKRGEIRDFFTDRVSLDLTRARARLADRGLKYYGHVNLTSGRYLARILIRDSTTGATTVTSRALDLEATAKPGPHLLPPFFVDASSRWLLARQPAQTETIVYPFNLRGKPFVPAVTPILTRGEITDVYLVAYGFGTGALNLTARLSLAGSHTATSEPTADYLLRLVGRLAGNIADRAELLARFEPLDLAPGAYRLLVTLTDPLTGEDASAGIALRIAAPETDTR